MHAQSPINLAGDRTSVVDVSTCIGNARATGSKFVAVDVRYIQRKKKTFLCRGLTVKEAGSR